MSANWRSDITVARELTKRCSETPGLIGPLIDKMDADEWRIRRRIAKRYRGTTAKWLCLMPKFMLEECMRGLEQELRLLGETPRNHYT